MKNKEKSIKNIKVTETTYKQLEDYRIADGETFNSIIKRLLNNKDRERKEK